MKSLQAQQKHFAQIQHQLDVLENQSGIPKFADKIADFGYQNFTPNNLDILQINLGKMCNQVCNHCHVDAGPDRKEIMTKSTMDYCIQVAQKTGVKTVDLTGGAPEMNPHFTYLVSELSKLGIEIIVRSNLTILVANEKYKTYPEFFKQHGVTVISSLPCYTSDNVDKQRGIGVFDASIKALKKLNEIGYGMPNSNLKLHLVYNPGGPSLPPPQEKLQADYTHFLQQNFGISFNNLYTITNIPISRFLDYLVASGAYEKYMQKLLDAFNPSAVNGVMCRNTVSVSWDGFLYDCDFNQMLDLKVQHAPTHIADFDLQKMQQRKIVVNQHCYGCTAGAGSSCQGSIV